MWNSAPRSRKIAILGVLILLFACVHAPAFAGVVTALPAQDAPAVQSSGFFDLFKVYMPRRQCMFNEPAVIWSHLLSDSLIFLSYYSIPLALIYFIRRRKDLVFHWMFYFFAAFILACGTTHLMSALAIWYPLYRLDAVIKILTAAISLCTAAMLWPLIPKALAIPSRGQLRAAHQQLEAEFSKARQAESELRAIRADLESRVRVRTAELAEANDSLRNEITLRQGAETEREALLRSERAARQDAERANRMKDEFLATLSHELRTPINAICGWTQLLRSGHPGSAAEISEGLEVIDRNARMQTRLIDDLLDMSRIISGKIQLEIQPTDLPKVIEAALDTVKPAAEARGVQLLQNIDLGSAPVVGDPARLQQVIWNLLSNAVKFTPRGGRVTISARRLGSHVEVCVQDNGIGITADFLPFVFDRFRQADASTTRRHGGLGLGLAIVKSLIELHGGSIRAASFGAGQGTTFTFQLPLAGRESPRPDAPAAAAAGPAQPPHLLAGVTVLIVDDEPDARKIVRRALEEYDAAVLEAASTAEALDLFRQSRPHLLISDIGMPDEDGFSFIQRIRALPAAEGGLVPAIALTAFARTEDRVRSLATGFQAHLSKPVAIDQLLGVIAEITRAGAPR